MPGFALNPPGPAAIHPGFEFGGAYAAGLAFMGCVLLVGIYVLSRQRARPWSAALVYLLAGALASIGLGALGVTRLEPVTDHVVFERVTELALIVAVFGSGLSVERQVRTSSWRLIAVLLVGVMPATIALIALFGATAMGLPFGAAVLLGAVLAPTDPVLAGDVGLAAPGEPEVGEPRLSLHTEAGANDGLASPFVVAGLLIATHHSASWIGGWLSVDLLYRVGIALVLGIAAGVVAAAAITGLHARELLSAELDGFLALALSLVVYGICDLVGGYGLVAVFAAGIAFRRAGAEDVLPARIHTGSERLGRLLELAVLVLVGSALTTTGLALPGVAGWLLAPVLILIIRPVLVALACLGSPLRAPERHFLGFFGVRGVAAVYYAAVVAGDHVLSPHLTDVVVWTTIACVAVSIVVHGISATPLMHRWLGEE
jgi:NhaP-type Na+/H+ or K+/H+ antiporter